MCGIEEVAQLIKWLSCKNKDLSLTLQYKCKTITNKQKMQAIIVWGVTQSYVMLVPGPCWFT